MQFCEARRNQAQYYIEVGRVTSFPKSCLLASSSVLLTLLRSSWDMPFTAGHSSLNLAPWAINRSRALLKRTWNLHWITLVHCCRPSVSASQRKPHTRSPPKRPHPELFLIAFLALPTSISSSRSSAARPTILGTGPSTARTKLLCALRSAGGTRMPNQRIGSSGRGPLPSAAGVLGASAVLLPSFSTLALLSSSGPSLSSLSLRSSFATEAETGSVGSLGDLPGSSALPSAGVSASAGSVGGSARRRVRVSLEFSSSMVLWVRGVSVLCWCARR